MKLSKVQGMILFIILVSITMSAAMSFGILAIRMGFQPNFFKMWVNDFLVGCAIAIPVSFVIVPLLKKLTDNLTEQ